MKFTYTLLIYFICFGALFSQNEESKKKYYIAYDSIVGIENLNLFNGKIFIDYFNSNKKEHRFFKNFIYLKGSIINKQQPYYNLYLKYDLLEDQLILKPNTESNFLEIKLISENISHFKIDEHEFINFKDNQPLKELGLNSFLEIIYKGQQLNLYCKYTKTQKEKIIKNKLHFIFKNQTTFLLEYNSTFYKIKSNKKIRKIFPKMEKFLNNYYKTNPQLLKNNPEQFFKLLSYQIDNQL